MKADRRQRSGLSRCSFSRQREESRRKGLESGKSSGMEESMVSVSVNLGRESIDPLGEISLFSNQ